MSPPTSATRCRASSNESGRGPGVRRCTSSSDASSMSVCGPSSSTRRGLTVPFFDLGPSHANLRAAILRDLRAADRGERLHERPPGRRVRAGLRGFLRYGDLRRHLRAVSTRFGWRFSLQASRRVTRSSSLPERSSPRSRPSRRRAGARSSSTSSDDDYCLDVDAAAAAIGAANALRAAGPSLRPDGRHARARRARRSARPRGHRGRVPGARRRRATGCGPAPPALPAAFSFYPGEEPRRVRRRGRARHATTMTLAATVRALREHGQRQKYRHAVEGYTARLDTIQALVLLHKLPLLDGLERRSAARRRATTPTALAGRRRPAVAAGRDGQRAGLAPLRRPDGRPRARSQRTSASAGSAPAATTPSRCT